MLFSRHLSIFGVSCHLPRCYGNHVGMHAQAAQEKIQIMTLFEYFSNTASGIFVKNDEWINCGCKTADSGSNNES